MEAEVASVLSQYGLLGVMMVMMVAAIRYMARRDVERDVKMTQVVQNNTIALTRFVDATKKCEVRKNG